MKYTLSKPLFTHGRYVHFQINSNGLCPICGEQVTIIGETADSRLIGSCRDAFTLKRWLEE